MSDKDGGEGSHGKRGPAQKDNWSSLKYLRCGRPLATSPGVVHVELHRPERSNAFIEPWVHLPSQLPPKMWQELGNLFEQLSADSSVSAIVLSSSHPRAFTTGLDTTTLLTDRRFDRSQFADNARHTLCLQDFIASFQASLTQVAECRRPLVVAMHGHCLGLAIDLALCADVRFASADARFAVKEVDVGLAADVGTLTRMPKVVGNGSWIYDVALSGRVFGAQEARDMGLISRVCQGQVQGQGSSLGHSGKTESGVTASRDQVVTEALSWAETVASKSPIAVRGTKELLKWSWDRSVADGLKYTAVWNGAMLQTDDLRESVEAGFQRRKARFSKL